MSRSCENCGNELTGDVRKATKYCSLACCYEFRNKKVDKWAKCSCCLAAVGLSASATGRVLFVYRERVTRTWKREGVSQDKPDCKDWSFYVARERLDRELYEKARMADIKKAHSKGFTWSYLWTKEKAIRHSQARYDSMTSDEKDEHNRRCYERRRAKCEDDEGYRERHNERIRRWKRNNPEYRKKQRNYHRQWVVNNPGVLQARMKERKASDPGFRVQCNMRNRFKDLMKSAKGGGTSNIRKVIGCTTKELAAHLESMFTSMMSWDNYGVYWHVDHILPCTSFDHTDDRQVAQCWHWTNLQPLEATENLRKSDSIESPQMSLLMEFSH